MPDFPSPRWPVLNVITPFHSDSLGVLAIRAANNLHGATSTAMVANLALYYPFRVYEYTPVVRWLLLVGATNTGNVDMGVYDAELNRLDNTGSLALGTANTLMGDSQIFAINPGSYLMAIQFSSSSGTAFAVTSSDERTLPVVPVYEQAVGSFGLPATAVPVLSTSVAPPIIAFGFGIDTVV